MVYNELKDYDLMFYLTNKIKLFKIYLQNMKMCSSYAAKLNIQEVKL